MLMKAKVALMGLLSAISGLPGSLGFGEAMTYPGRGGTPSKRKGLGNHKADFRAHHPNQSMDLLQYERRYGGTAALKARFPFSTKKH